ncbi:MAG: bifunctional phosphopantothenoylcysteine decarboxylase/phosphopantothenate--cysteine ligase CoaBC [Pseudomonadota bacterium]
MSSTVLLGISGGIAAYKIPGLVRLLRQADMAVNVVMSEAAVQFVTPLTLATLSGNPVWTDMWGQRNRPSVEHISLADSADAAVIAPATANIIGKIANGIADDLLSTVVMAIKCPLLICPSMNVNMYRNPILQENLEKLKRVGYRVMEPEAGYLACGWTGEGRLPEPDLIFERILGLMTRHDLEGVRILVTAGPTEEPLDPARVLTNRSSGKMGTAVARRAAYRGASVVLVAGPLKVRPPVGVKHIPVQTAREMHERVLKEFPNVDVVIKAAAVADFRPEMPGKGKMKKEDVGSALPLIRNPDIIAELGKIKTRDQILVGFAAETDNAAANARAKLKRKNLDMLVLNDVSKPGAGFDHDTNIVSFFYKSREEEELAMMSKDDVADRILDRVLQLRASLETGNA